MDYSAINNDDPEHPVGHDPWASSPQATKTTFSPRTSIEDPSSPTPNPPQSGLPDRSLESRGGFGNNDDEGVFRAQHPAASAVENGHVDHERTPSDQLPPSQQQQQPRPQQQYPPPPQPNFQQAPMSQQQQNQGPTQQPRQAQRYRQRPRSRQDLPQQPHRFMQPKVNGIERPTRKDLIVRFDIHVSSSTRPIPCHANRHWYISANNSSFTTSDQPPRLPHLPVPRHPPHTRRV